MTKNNHHTAFTSIDRRLHKPNHYKWGMLYLPFALLLTFASAEAERAFPCLTGSTGKTIQWSASWQNDRQDDNQPYQISDILHFETNASYSVVLKLVSGPSAQKQERHLAIVSAASAQAVCQRMTNNLSSSWNSTPSSKVSVEQPRRAPQFIRYLRHGWVRADLPRAQMPLSTCEIMGREFLCLEEEKQRFGEQLQLVAEQIEAQPTLRR